MPVVIARGARGEYVRGDMRKCVKCQSIRNPGPKNKR